MLISSCENQEKPPPLAKAPPPLPEKAQRYRIRNWQEYNAALVARGSLTIWLDQAACQAWLNEPRSGHRGASDTYSDVAIATAWHLKVVYHLCAALNRMTQLGMRQTATAFLLTNAMCHNRIHIRPEIPLSLTQDLPSDQVSGLWVLVVGCRIF